MRIFNEDKTKELNEDEIDFTFFKLVPSKIFICHHDAVEEIQKQSHYEVTAEYENGGKDLKEIIDIPYQPYKEAYDEYEDILVKTALTKEEVVNNLRTLREIECFSIINQNYVVDGKSYAWFDTLSDKQKIDANKWAQQWRDVTETKVIPEKPAWLK